jgi:hypothetical protein
MPANIEGSPTIGEPAETHLVALLREVRLRRKPVTNTPIDEAAAIQIAKRAAADRGYRWIEPVRAVERKDEFMVSSNAEVLGGGTVVVLIDGATGEIRSIDFYDR